MILSTRQLLGILDKGIAIVQLSGFIKQNEELYEGEHEEVHKALKKVVGEDYMAYVEYARENNVAYNLGWITKVRRHNSLEVIPLGHYLKRRINKLNSPLFW